MNSRPRRRSSSAHLSRLLNVNEATRQKKKWNQSVCSVQPCSQNKTQNTPAVSRVLVPASFKQAKQSLKRALWSPEISASVTFGQWLTEWKLSQTWNPHDVNKFTRCELQISSRNTLRGFVLFLCGKKTKRNKVRSRRWAGFVFETSDSQTCSHQVSQHINATQFKQTRTPSSKQEL